jgi:hypothetical protein
VHIIFVDTFQLSTCHVSIILNSDVLACVWRVLKSALQILIVLKIVARLLADGKEFNFYTLVGILICSSV